jgi:hypothetical protein
MRQDLRGLLQRLAALPKENLDLSRRYLGDQQARDWASSLITQESTLLSRQAAEIARALPKGTVSATEYNAIASALQASYNFKGAKEFYDLSLENAKDFDDEIAALRAGANLEFVAGHPESGRVEYQKALGIFSKYQGYDSYTINSTGVGTELSWAFSEASIGKTDLADQHMSNADSYLRNILPGPNYQMLAASIAQGRTSMHGGAGAAPTSLSTVGAVASQPR